MDSLLYLIQNFDPTHWVLLVTLMIATIAWFRASTAFDKVQSKLKELSEAHSKNLQELKEKQESYDALKKTFHEQSENYESLEQTYAETQQRLKKYETAYSKLYRQQADYEKRLAVLRQREADVHRREEERNEADKTIGTLQSSIACVKNDLAETTTRLETTRAKLREAKKNILSRNADIDKLKHLGQSDLRYRKQRLTLKCAVGSLLCRLQFTNEDARREAQNFVLNEQKGFRKLLNKKPELMEKGKTFANDFIGLSRAITEKDSE